jgi:hypothetical protein
MDSECRISGLRLSRPHLSRALVNAICRTFPGAQVSDPWGGGHDAWKVGGKMFAYIGAVMPGVSVKTDSIDTAEMLIGAGLAIRLPSMLLRAAGKTVDTPPHHIRETRR